MKRGIVLEGGAAYCAFQAGAIQELGRQGIDFSHVVGVSAGALNGCAIVLGKTEALYDMWSSIKGFRFINLRHVLWNRSPFDMSRLTHKLILDFFPPAQLMQSDIALHVITTQLPSCRRVVHTNRGDVDMLAVLRASNLIPIVHSRLILIDGAFHIDGGIADNTPIDVAFAAGCDEVIAIVNNARGALYANPVTKRRKPTAAYGDRLVVIHPPHPLPIRATFDFDSTRMDTAFAMGQAAAAEMLQRKNRVAG